MPEQIQGIKCIKNVIMGILLLYQQMKIYKEMLMEKMKSTYDDGNIPEIDMPQSDNATNNIPEEFPVTVEPLPESTRPRKDGPGGE
ncbi:UNVERIFIED_CONTAM: hypothetical protein C7383_101215 [Murimonas intestini]|uniref:Uncharacterized protein n=2 Tax=Murimonas intestini TaxID=1337051 RepID=A0AB73T9I6_9FIRM